MQTRVISWYIPLALMALVTGILLLTPELVHAQAASAISSGLDEAAGDSYADSPGLTTLVGNLISVLLTVTGLIFLVITVYAGILYMTAAGEIEKVKKAKSMLISSVIGIVIVVSAYAITTFIVDQLVTATAISQEEG